MLYIGFILFIGLAKECYAQDDNGPYLGRSIGEFNTYHHQVSGDVYAVDDWTLLLVNFNYDGTGVDTFFWAGDSGRPGPQGFIIPDQFGKTNVLERYYNEEVRLTLPEGKRISRIKWFAVYDIDSQNAFGDVYIPEDFSAPAPQSLAAFSSAAVTSKPLRVLDASTILIPEFRYDGRGEEAYFWTGVGPQPSSRGFKIPDEYGYLEPIRAYKGEDVRLELPGGKTIFDVNWISVYDASARASLGAVLVPDGLNVPPAALVTHPHESKLSQCKQLHRDLQVSWNVHGREITIELAGQIEEDEYMSFGISGAAERSAMLGADVAVARYSLAERRGLVTDYNISDVAPCVRVLGVWRGVCRDTAVGGLDSPQLLYASREDSLTRITYRTNQQPDEALDREWKKDGDLYVVWAVGKLDSLMEPAFHRLYPRHDVIIRLNNTLPDNDCFKFTIGSRARPSPWEVAQLFDPTLRVFQFRVGPAGGARGVAGRAEGHAPPLAWYVNGQLAPDIQLRRGLTYTFYVYGGNEPHSATEYHPLVVTAEQGGGLERLSDSALRQVRVLAGLHYSRRGLLQPTAAGGLCLGRAAEEADRRRDADYVTFRAYNRSLRWECASASPAALTVSPNSSWPDIVYYNSFTHAGMGGRIYIVDRHNRNIARKSAAATLAPLTPLTVLTALTVLTVLTALTAR